jgi:hypothetical protein
MSHAFGAVRFPDGTIYFFGYDGDTHGCSGRLYKTEQEVVDRWFKPLKGKCQNCMRQEAVGIMALGTEPFGNWKGIACRGCMVLIESVPGLSWSPGMPDWSPWGKNANKKTS